MCCCVFWVHFSTTSMFVCFFFFLLCSGLSSGLLFLYLPYLRRHLSAVYLCQHWAPEKGTAARSSVPRIGAAHSSVKRLCVFTCGRRGASPSLYLCLFWPLRLERRCDKSSHLAALLTSALLSQPHLTPQETLSPQHLWAPALPFVGGLRDAAIVSRDTLV